MSKGNTTENQLLALFFNKTIPAWLGTLSGTGDTDITVALHTADPGEAGTQSTSEATYTGYARVNVIRTAAGWTVASNVASNTALVQFGEATAGTNTITHVSLGINSGQIMYKGSLTSARTISSGIQPQFNIANLQITEE